MKVTQVKKDNNGELYIDGDYSFKLSDEITRINKHEQPVKSISFDWCLEAPFADHNKMCEMLAEKLKVDFFNYLQKDRK